MPKIADFSPIVEFQIVPDIYGGYYYLATQNQERWQAISSNRRNWLKIAGIYGIYNIKTDRVYVGRSRNLWSRWMLHLSELRREVHHAPDLQKEWNVFGCDAFRFLVFETCEESRLLWGERFWADSFNKSFLYNKAPLKAIPDDPACCDLKDLRERTGISTPKVAWLMEVTEHTVQGWEKGRSTPRLDVFKTAELCKLYQCSIEELAAAAKVTELKTGGDRNEQ